MSAFTQVNWFWRPIGTGRHAFHTEAKEADPTSTVTTHCGSEVEAHLVQRTPTEIEWITEPTCMTCWHRIADRRT
ncbi:zinc finger protein [Saccharopolyspora flava]|uniref:Zinc-finger n=1 Tax=Saccharopolyspora flava TaxID=95161 RepID=A0A1I6P264_9PSEU|nr:zinc finger protein [Saccharopolyspora flava]SFS34282.1 zinc-finger [Saccharopolyspora flava]